VAKLSQVDIAATKEWANCAARPMSWWTADHTGEVVFNYLFG